MATVNQPAMSLQECWRNRPLPILQESRNELMGMMRRAERIPAREIAEVVLQDPLLTTQLLRLVNQRPRTPMAVDVVAIESAIMLLGITPFLERFARAQTVESLMLPDHQNEYARVLKKIFECRLARRLAREFANQRYDAHLDEIQAAAILSEFDDILHGLGRILEPTLQSAPGDFEPVLAVWQIPRAVVELLGAEGEPSSRQALQQAVVKLARLLERGWWQDDVQQQLAVIASVLNQPVERIWCTLCEQLLRFSRREGRSRQIYTPARYLVMLPGEWPKPPAPAASTADAQIIKNLLSERMQALHLAGLNGASTNQVMGLAVRAIGEGLGMQRIVFSLLMAGENCLRARYVQGVEQADALRTLNIQLEAPHIFTRLLQKPQSILLTAQNRAQYAPHLPDDFLRQAGEASFCAMSIFVGDKPVGLMYADCGKRGGVTDYHYQHFKQICTLASRALAHNAKRAQA